MRAIAVIEQEYGFKLEVAGGRHTSWFNATTRAALDQGGNEFDAASKFMATLSILARGTDGPSDQCISRAPVVTARLLPRMARPDRSADDWDVALSPMEPSA